MIMQPPVQTDDAPVVTILENGNILKADLDGLSSRFHAVWLRDNGHDDRSIDLSNRQKLITLRDIPPDNFIKSATVNGSWELEIAFGPDNWHTRIPFKWLWEHRYDGVGNPDQSLFADGIETWDAGFSGALPKAGFEDASHNPDVLLAWLQGIARYGAALMTGLPKRELVVLDVINLFGFARETNYGKVFQIRSEPDPVNLAYTTKGLQPHTDNPYRDPVPGLQFFNCLENTSDGGESVLVDGFRIVETLHRETPGSFDRLCRFRNRFRYTGSHDTELEAARPLIQRDVTGKVTGVSFNNRSSAALTDVPYDEMTAYYADCRRFEALVRSRDLQVMFRLNPGELFVTDNTRVLHGRTGYSNSSKRWMQGAYADKDALHSKIRVLGNKRGNR